MAFPEDSPDGIISIVTIVSFPQLTSSKCHPWLTVSAILNPQNMVPTFLQHIVSYRDADSRGAAWSNHCCLRLPQFITESEQGHVKVSLIR